MPRFVATLIYFTFPMTPKVTLTETKCNTVPHGWGTWLAKALLRMKAGFELLMPPQS